MMMSIHAPQEYKPQPSQPALVYFLAQTSRNFGIFSPVLAIMLQIYALFGEIFTGGGAPKSSNIRYAQGDMLSECLWFPWSKPFFYSSFLLSYINSVAAKLHSFGITLKKMKLHAFVSIIHRPSGGRSTFEAKLIFRGIDMGRINPRI